MDNVLRDVEDVAGSRAVHPYGHLVLREQATGGDGAETTAGKWVTYGYLRMVRRRQSIHRGSGIRDRASDSRGLREGGVDCHGEKGGKEESDNDSDGHSVPHALTPFIRKMSRYA
jgi:hypothetical protein